MPEHTIPPVKRVAVITHFYSPGPAHELVDFLVPRTEEVVFLGRPLPAKSEAPSFLKRYKHGELRTEKSGRVFSAPDILRYALDVAAVVWFLLINPRFDLIISLDPLNTAAVRMAKFVGKVPRYVYYTIDYIPNRFGSPWLNNFYHWLDRMGVKGSAFTWNLSSRMTKARARLWKTHQYDAKQLEVPMGTHPLNVSLAKKDPATVIFMGHLRPGQGVDQLIKAVALAAAKLPNLKAVIVGGGELLDSLQRQAIDLGVADRIRFTGFVADNEAMRAELIHATLAVAPYERRADNYTQYSDPGKPKEYLAAGLPVLISDVPAIARTIAEAQAGAIIDDDAKSISDAIIRILKDSENLRTFQEAALALARSFDWDTQYTNTFEQMGTYLEK